jgi:peptidoglycan/xylan/chitin deacetylase (PgdA/CDA1 family)
MAIAITFDDGPNKTTTLEMLSLLEDLRIPATFFVLGYMVEKNWESLKAIAASKLKHEIGNHSWSHGNFEKMTDDQLRTEITSVNNLVVHVLGKDYLPRLVRPPKGQIRKVQRKIIGELSMKVCGWDIDPADWSHHKTEKMVIDHILAKTEDTKVILCHDVHATTVDAMKTVLPALLKKKFTFSTVSNLGRVPSGGLTG